MNSPSQPLWPFNYCDLDKQTQCGCLGLAVCPRNRETSGELRDFAGMPRMIMSPEDLQHHLASRELPDYLQNWLVFSDDFLSIDRVNNHANLCNAIGASFRDRLTRAIAGLTLSTDLERLAAYYASLVPIEQLLSKTARVQTCGYTYHGRQILFADNSDAQWLIDSICHDIEFYGPLLDTFTHATPGVQGVFNGGTLGPSDTRHFMPLCHVQSAGMLLHLYLVGLPMKADTSDCFHALALKLVGQVYSTLASKLSYSDYAALDHFARARVFDAQTVLGTVDENSAAQEVLECVHALLLRPAASVAASFSHSPSPRLPPVCARKLLSMATMASKQTRSSDFGALVKGVKKNERQGLMVPNVIYGT